MICPNCEKEIETDTAQCPHCGCHFPVKVKSKPNLIPVPITENQTDAKLLEKGAPSEIQKITMVQKCPKCGKPIAVNVHFCKWCGSSLSQTQKNPPTVSDCQPVVLKSTETDIPITNVCKNCGHTIKATAMFCKWCGSPCSK